MDAKDQYGQIITHITQGCIEKHFGTLKSSNDHTSLYPAAYASEIVNDVLTACKTLEPVATKKIKQLKSMYSKKKNYSLILKIHFRRTECNNCNRYFCTETSN